MSQLNNIIHQPARLKIMAVLTVLDNDEQVDFTHIKKLLKLTDGNLGAHLIKLEQTGYITLEKTFIDKKPRTFIKITGKGRDAFNEHIEALKIIISGNEKT